MTLKLTAASFMACLKRSELIEAKRLDSLMASFQKQGVDLNDTQALSDALIQADALTEWQASKLQQGRYKGFFLGRYRLLRLLSTGETSAVYLAKHLFMNRMCAIKVLPGHRVKDTSYLARFYREAEAVASLDHQNIVRAYDIGCQEDNGADLHYLILQYVDGQNLEQLVLKSKPLPLPRIIDLIRQAAEGLAHAHASGLIHRDIKPANLLITPDHTLKLVDLGLARFFKATEEESLTVKHDEKVLGTADYLAPEQAVDSHQVDERADIYALGCTLYFALTGHPPFRDGTLVQRLLAHQTRQPPSVKQKRPDTPDEIVTILNRMMAKKREGRYQSAKEVADILGRWLVQHGDSTWREQHWNLVIANKPTDKATPSQPINSHVVEGATTKTASSSQPSSSQKATAANKAIARKSAKPKKQPANQASNQPSRRVSQRSTNSTTPASMPQLNLKPERISKRVTKSRPRSHRAVLVLAGLLFGAIAIGLWQWSVYGSHSAAEQVNSTPFEPIQPETSMTIEPLDDSEIRGGN